MVLLRSDDRPLPQGPVGGGVGPPAGEFGPNREIHDGFRQVDGTLERSVCALGWARAAGLGVQVNTTVTRHSVHHLQGMYELLCREGAPPVKRWSLFMLVPMGRGVELALPSAQQVEAMFSWVYATAREAPFRIGTTEAPHYRRFWIQQQLAEGASREQINARGRQMAFGVRDGNGVVSCRIAAMFIRRDSCPVRCWAMFASGRLRRSIASTSILFNFAIQTITRLAAAAASSSTHAVGLVRVHSR